MRNITLLSSALLLLSACGLKGPLYLPQEPPAAQSSAAAPASTPADEKKKPAAGQSGQ